MRVIRNRFPAKLAICTNKRILFNDNKIYFDLFGYSQISNKYKLVNMFLIYIIYGLSKWVLWRYFYQVVTQHTLRTREVKQRWKLIDVMYFFSLLKRSCSYAWLWQPPRKAPLERRDGNTQHLIVRVKICSYSQQILLTILLDTCAPISELHFSIIAIG